jgi:hypothetical protein
MYPNDGGHEELLWLWPLSRPLCKEPRKAGPTMQLRCVACSFFRELL